MVLKFLTLKNEMEWALRELGYDIPKDVRIGEAAVLELKKNVEAYIRVATKLSAEFMTGMTKRSTMQKNEVSIAVEAVTRALIDEEIQRKRERDKKKVHPR